MASNSKANDNELTKIIPAFLIIRKSVKRKRTRVMAELIVLNNLFSFFVKGF